VVIDDGSAHPPVDIVKRFPRVTLLASTENVGPYRLLQHIICDADYDAVLVQDADDWSTPDRHERLLAEAERTGRKVVSSQYDDVFADGRRQPCGPPPGQRHRRLRADPAGWFTCFGAALIRRELVLRLGGLSGGLRFSGDMEFFHRRAPCRPHR